MSDFFGQHGVGTTWPGPDRGTTAGVREEWGIQVYDNATALATYDSRDAALRAMEAHRKNLRGLGIPEEYWPIMLSRTVETVVGSWNYHGE